MKLTTLVALAASVLSLLVMPTVSGCAPNYKVGDAAGNISSFSNQGLVFPSWEGYINMGGMREERKSIQHTDGKGRSASTVVTQMVPNVMKFHVTDPIVIEQVKAAVACGCSVKVTYHTYLIAPVTVSSRNTVTAVTVME